MENKKQPQINISMPNLINICVDKKTHGEISGRLYHCYEKEPVIFGNIIELLKIAEDLFEKLGYPQASTKTRRFYETTEIIPMQGIRPPKVTEQTEIIKYRGELGSFVTCVRFRQNSTWQGEVFWMERGIRRQFSNTLNFIKTLDSALATIE